MIITEKDWEKATEEQSLDDVQYDPKHESLFVLGVRG
jgi:hypothetical protein